VQQEEFMSKLTYDGPYCVFEASGAGCVQCCGIFVSPWAEFETLASQQQPEGRNTIHSFAAIGAKTATKLFG
jgi:hypothetical protein